MIRSIRSTFASFCRPLALLCLSLILLTFSRPSLAGPADPKHLPADAKWYVHLDFEAAKQTAIYSQALDIAKAQFPLETVTTQLKNTIGVNPLTDITGVTIYNTSFEKDAFALIVHAKVNQQMLQLAVSNAMDYKPVEYGKYVVHTWTDDKDGRTKFGSFYGDGMVLMSDSMENIKSAIDVLDGKKTAGSSLVKTPAKGAFLYGAVDLKGAQVGDKNLSQLLANAEGATASIGEAEGNLNIAVNFNSKSAEVAAQLKKMIDGAQVFGEFATRNDHPTVADLIHKIQVTLDGTKVTATFEHDSKTILQTLQKIDEENKAKVAKEQQVPPKL